MLDYYVLPIKKGVSYGSVTLKALQNDNVSELDLLVREAVQNSSDAALNMPGDSFAVNFSSGKFIPSDFNSYMVGLEDVLNKRFNSESGTFLEIRDTKTIGLTGSVKDSDIKGKEDHGNFYKLIYDTGKRQTISTAGGNWGFGKSVYYRVGIGIVIFYSQIQLENKEFESRLIITLVEDENKKDKFDKDDTLLNELEPLSAGKAWWGIREGEKEDILPITDKSLISDILNVFGIKPFKDKETGTSVIIPFINEEELLNGILPVEAEIDSAVKDHFVEQWGSSISDYLRLAVQKWYCPKIHNRKLPEFCKNKWLLVSVDNKPIRKTDLLSFFNLVQELYTAALAKSYSYDYESKDYPNIEVLTIKIMNYFENKNTAGYLATIRITKDELMGSKNELSPYIYTSKFEAEGGLNEPIVMYARDPGMVIEYAITGPWVKNIEPPESEEEFLFGFFVPVTERIIKNDLPVPDYAGMQLGEYLRKCEASDHMGWDDPVKMQIVQKIQKNTVNQIRKQIKANNPISIDATASKLSSRLGRGLLPLVGTKKTSPDPNPNPPVTKINNVKITFTSQAIQENYVELEYVINLFHGKKDVALSVMIASEAGWINAEQWNKDIGTVFPIEIIEFYFDNIKSMVQEDPYEIQESCNKEKKTYKSEILDAEIIEESGVDTKVVFKAYMQNPEIKGRIKIHTMDKKYQFNFKVE